jgi:UDP-GlcNAc:undecaprenyl-phosphate GlcNAc-1-phosphate transferase
VLGAMAVVFGVAAGTTALLTPLVRWLSIRAGLYAVPTPRKIHVHPIPQLGGAAIFIGFVAAMLVSFLFTGAEGPLTRDYFENLRLVLMLVGATLLWIVSLIDDIKELPALPRLIWQFFCALIAVGPYLWEQQLHGPTEQASGIVFTAYINPLTGDVINLHYWGPWIAIGVTVFWIVGMTNMLNMLDGLDGLAAGVTLIAAGILALHTWTLNQYTILLLPLAMAGVCLGFLPYNFHPARIFMGDSGAMVLGYLLSIAAIIGGAKMSSALLVLGVPIIDASWMIMYRLLRGQHMMQADRRHLHHRLLDLGMSQRQVVMLYYGMSALFGTIAVVVPSEARLVKIAALVFLTIMIVGFLIYVTRQEPERIVARRKRRAT